MGLLDKSIDEMAGIDAEKSLSDLERWFEEGVFLFPDLQNERFLPLHNEAQQRARAFFHFMDRKTFADIDVDPVTGWVLPSRKIISTLDVPDRFVALFNRLVPELLDFHERVTKGPLAEHATVAQEAKGSLALALCAACALNQRQWIDPIVDACPSALHEWVPSVAITSEFGNDLSYSTAFHALHWGRSDFFKDLVAKGLNANKPPLKVNGPNNSYTHDWAKTLEYTPLKAPPSTVHNALVFLNM